MHKNMQCIKNQNASNKMREMNNGNASNWNQYEINIKSGKLSQI